MAYKKYLPKVGLLPVAFKYIEDDLHMGEYLLSIGNKMVVSLPENVRFTSPSSVGREICVS